VEPRCGPYHDGAGSRYARVLARLAKRLLFFAAALAALYVAGAAFGPLGAALAGLALFSVTGLVLVLLPRTAHRGFRRGAFRRAGLTYRLLGRLRLDREVRAALQVSVAACLLGRERYRDGLAVLARIDTGALGESARAAWLNNRAYALARSGGDGAQALADIEEAISLRPDLSGFRHTRGLALLATGRLDDAIRELDAVWLKGGASETSPLLESERCYDLGLAWHRKGERDYAADYFDRARRAAPDSVWATRALAELRPPDRVPDVLADLV
jgi:tetratricopeptide (TPR) repeat protein